MPHRSPSPCSASLLLLTLAALGASSVDAAVFSFEKALAIGSISPLEAPKPVHAAAQSWLAVVSHGDLQAIRTFDDGVSWTLPVTIQAGFPGTDSAEVEASVATRPGSSIVRVVWSSTGGLSDASNDHDIALTSSNNVGETWTPPVLLNSDPGSDAGREDHHPTIATDGDGTWVVAWISSLAGVHTVLATRSVDDAGSWSAPVQLAARAGFDAVDAPTVAADAQGNWAIAWSGDVGPSGEDLSHRRAMVVVSSDGGGTWSSPAGLDVDAGDEFEDSNATVAVHEGAMLAAWDSDDPREGDIGRDLDILSRRSTTAGSTWEDVVVLNTSARADAGDDWNPTLVVDPDGTWLAAWQSGDHFTKALGIDIDLLHARSRDGANWNDASALNTSAASDEGGLPGKDFEGEAAFARSADGRWMSAWSYAAETTGDFVAHVARSRPDCPSVPASPCRGPAPGASKLTLVSGVLGRDRLLWSWSSPTAFAADEFVSTEDPTHSLCLYQDSGPGWVLEMEEDLIDRLGCGSDVDFRPCWTSSAFSWRYSDPSGVAGGLQGLFARSSGSGARFKISTRNPLLDTPRLPLDTDPGVLLQFHAHESGACYEGLFRTPIKNTDTTFRAQSE